MPVSRQPEAQAGAGRLWARIQGPVLVTGAAAGIGKAISAALADAGVPLALLDNDQARLAATVEELDRSSAPALGITCDVADERAVEAAFAKAGAALGPLAGAVANAGIEATERADEMRTETWDRVMAVNLRGAFLTCRAASTVMREHRGGSIVCISSPIAHAAIPGSAAYGASKGGIRSMVRAMAVDEADAEIRVNAVMPGATETPMMWRDIPEAEREGIEEELNQQIPLSRLGAPEEVAEAVLWLLSDSAAYVTGAELRCDGGLLARAAISV